MRAIIFLAVPSLLGGCAAPRALPPTLDVPAGSYVAAFDAAREVLRSMRFDLDRIDAGAGVISTEPKRSGGLATPWDSEQTTWRDEFEDLANHQQRTVRITFQPVELAGPPSEEPPLGEGLPVDLREYDGPLIAHVLVVVEREHRSGWRVETTAIHFSSFTQDPALGSRGMAGSYWTPVSQDRLLAGRLAERIGREAGLRPSGPGGG